MGWPETKEDVPNNIHQYWNIRDELTVQDGVIYKGMKAVIPTILRKQMIAKAHKSHLGINACIRRAKDVIYWPGMAGEITDAVKTCSTCCEFMDKQQKEPLMTHKIPHLPWSKVGQDLFSLYGNDYLVTVDYFSDYFEIDTLDDTSAESVINATKDHFARHGIADMVTDNGPQYTSQKFEDFKTVWGFKHTTSSPYHSQSNGKAESAVKIAKKLIKKCKHDNTDLQMALLEWRNTPDIHGVSPTQKLMSRRTRTTMPTAEMLLKPEVADGIEEHTKLRRQKAKQNYDKTAKPLPELEIGENVKLQSVKTKPDKWTNGSCVAKVGPRSYLIETEDGKLYRRNRKFIRKDTTAETALKAEVIPSQIQIPVATTETPLQSEEVKIAPIKQVPLKDETTSNEAIENKQYTII